MLPSFFPQIGACLFLMQSYLVVCHEKTVKLYGDLRMGKQTYTPFFPFLWYKMILNVPKMMVGFLYFTVEIIIDFPILSGEL